MTRSRCAVPDYLGRNYLTHLNHFASLFDPIMPSFAMLSPSPVKLWLLDVLPSIRHRDASNPFPWNSHAYSASRNICHGLFSAHEVYVLIYAYSRRVYAFFNRNKIVLYGLSASLLLQTVAGLLQYTVHGGSRKSLLPAQGVDNQLTCSDASAAPLPLDNYEYHCKCRPSSLKPNDVPDVTSSLHLSPTYQNVCPCLLTPPCPN
jgi:hypothetical protein